jgi:putative transposase
MAREITEVCVLNANLNPFPSTATVSVTEGDLSEVPSPLWHMAQRRLEILRPLLHLEDRRRSDVQKAAQDVGCRVSWLYELLRRHREDGRLTSLLPRRRGRPLGHVRLEVAREALITAAIDEYYLTRQQPFLSALMMEIRRRAPKAGFSGSESRQRTSPFTATITARRDAATPRCEGCS